jgi:hypothetical protein
MIRFVITSESEAAAFRKAHDELYAAAGFLFAAQGRMANATAALSTVPEYITDLTDQQNEMADMIVALDSALSEWDEEREYQREPAYAGGFAR